MVYYYTTSWLRSRSRVLDIASTLRTGQFGVRILSGTRNFSLLPNFQFNSEVHTTSYSVGTGVLSLGGGVQPLRSEGNRSPHSSADITTAWSGTFAFLARTGKPLPLLL